MPPDVLGVRSPYHSESGSRGKGSASGDAYELYVTRHERVWHPPTDVCEDDKNVIVQVEIAGIEQDDFHVELVDRTLVIGGERRLPPGRQTYHNMEIHYGRFCSQVRIDWSIQESDIEASYENGFLYVRLPKPRQYHVPIVQKSSDSVV